MAKIIIEFLIILILQSINNAKAINEKATTLPVLKRDITTQASNDAGWTDENIFIKPCKSCSRLITISEMEVPNKYFQFYSPGAFMDICVTIPDGFKPECRTGRYSLPMLILDEKERKLIETERSLVTKLNGAIQEFDNRSRGLDYLESALISIAHDINQFSKDVGKTAKDWENKVRDAHNMCVDIYEHLKLMEACKYGICSKTSLKDKVKQVFQSPQPPPLSGFIRPNRPADDW